MRKRDLGNAACACANSLAAVLVAFLSTSAAALGLEPPQRFALRWTPAASNTNRLGVEVSGLDTNVLQTLRDVTWQPTQWQRLLAVYADQGDVRVDMWLPPTLGAYQVTAEALRFEPQFPLEPGVKYRAVFRPDYLPGASVPNGKAITSTFQKPPRQLNPTTVVRHIYPSADVLPENLLKFYVHFSAPMSGGHIYEHIHLRGADGEEVELPFLEIDEELWNADLTRLTLFIDPGRIKRGVLPLEEVGPALEQEKSYSLVIDAAWKDAGGNPLKESFQKTFQVGPPDRAPPDPARWIIRPPKPGTREPLTVAFAEPMDHALAQRVIQVGRESGGLIEGKTALEDQERRWSFVPAQPWRNGPHKLLVQTTIEDLAGNNIGKPFEVDLFEGVQRRLTNATVKVPFDVR